ncbi:MAG: hypothetical protein U0931_37350 [Vulcanimicrobiota bacterium]
MSARREGLKDLLALLAVAGLSLVACCIYYKCFTLDTLGRPWFTFNDVPLTQAYAKVAAEGQALPWKPRMVARLNAPFTANWCDFPTPDELIWDFCGLLSWCFGVSRGYNLAILIAHCLAGSAFYLAARLLGSARLPSLLCAVSYSLARFIFVRDTVHINLSYCWHLPFFWVIAGWFWERRPISRRGWLAILSLTALTAWQNPYYWFFWLVMLVPCWLVPLCQRDWRPAVGPLGVTAFSGFCLFLGQLDSWLGWQAYGRGYAFVRSVHELLVYGLRLSEFVLPMGHHWARLDEWAYQNYYRPMLFHTGETDSSYAGVIGLAALCLLLWDGFSRLQKGRSIPLTLWMSLWLAAVMVSGGLTMLAGSIGFLLFRCTGRSSILFLAGWLLYLSGRLTDKRLLQGRRGLLVIPLLLLVGWDYIPPYLEERPAVEAYVQNQRSAVEYLESKLPARAMVFQWPLMDYPESQRVGKMWHYDHLMAFLYSKDLRFSYGDCRNRPESQWQQQLRGKSPQFICAQLQRYGFSAIWLNSDGLEAGEKATWLQWRQPDYRSPQANLWLYRLQPALKPELPRLEPCKVLSQAFYGEEFDARLNMRFRWAWGRARIDLLLPNPCPYRYRFGLCALADRTMEIRLDGRLVTRQPVPTGYGVYRQFEFDLSGLRPGAHKIEIIPDGPALPPTESGRRLTFQYINESLEPLAGP